MKLEVRQVTEVTDSLLEAFGRLMPQLSPQLAQLPLQFSLMAILLY